MWEFLEEKNIRIPRGNKIRIPRGNNMRIPEENDVRIPRGNEHKNSSRKMLWGFLEEIT